MKKLFAILTILMLGISLFSVDFATVDSAYDHNADDVDDYGDVDNIDITELAGQNTVWLNFGIHSPVNTYNPALQFETRFILNEFVRLAIAGSFYNEAIFKNINDESNDTVYKEQDWNAIKNYLEAYIGWRVNDNVDLGFMLGGGVDIDDYYKRTTTRPDINKDTIERKIGYGFVSTGLGIKLKSNLFSSNLNYISVGQFFQAQISGAGSVGIEHFVFNDRSRAITDFDFGSTLGSSANFDASPDLEYTENTGLNDYFRYFGFRSYGSFGLSLPFNKLIGVFSRFYNFELIFGLEYELAIRFYYVYENYDITKGELEQYTNINHFDPTGFSLLIGTLFKPIKEIGIYCHYNPKFLVAGTEWVFDETQYKDYVFGIEHEVKATAKFMFPKVVTLQLGVIYNIIQLMEYQYIDDGTQIRSSIGGGSLSNSISHSIEPICELSFRIVDKSSASANLVFAWLPNIIIFDPDRHYYSNLTTGTWFADTNILNLANWSLEVNIEFDPMAL